MKAVIQRCTAARVEVDGEVVGNIGPGLAIFLGVGPEDDEAVAAKLARKVASLRIFDNEEGKFDRSLQDVKGAALVISNFTLYGDARKGTRPNFGGAARPEKAQALYECFVTLLQEQDVEVQTGTFAAAMKVCVDNDGPVTLVLDL
jgi:D-tyrosyl-tRNA(Tyr) deacylase